MGSKKDVFLMYSKKDDQKVKEIISLFEENGISFVDSNATANPQSEILNCKCMVFVSSESSRTLECEALKSYIPFAKKNANNIGKIEYVLDPENAKVPLVAKIVLKGFFSEEPCRDEESLIEAILTYVLEAGDSDEDVVEVPVAQKVVETPKPVEKKVEIAKPVEKIEEVAQPIEELEPEIIDAVEEIDDDYEEIVVGAPIVEVSEEEIVDENDFEEISDIAEDDEEEIIELSLAEDDLPKKSNVEIKIEEVKAEKTAPKKEKKQEELTEDLPETDFDVFLCYKERDFFNGSERENDSRDIREIFLYLQREGFKVFTKDEALADIKTPKGKEVYTERAIDSAKVMILYSSKPEFIESLFVKKDWIKYYTAMSKGEKKPNSMISVYKNFSPDKLPHPISTLDKLNKGDSDFKYKLKEFILNSLNSTVEEKQTVTEKKEEVKTIKLTKTKERVVSKGFTYVLSKDGSYGVKLGHATDKNLVLPEDYKDQKLEGIAKEGFLNATQIESVFIPKAYSKIKEFAFAGCSNLKKVVFEDDSELETINLNAFAGCTSLEEIVLPTSLIKISKNAFADSGLKSIFIPTSVDIIEQNVFENCTQLKEIKCAVNEEGSEWDENWNAGCDAIVILGDKEVSTNKQKKDNETLELVFEIDPSSSTLVLVKCDSKEKNVEIPAEINGKVVSKIKEGAFFDNEIIESVNIPKGIKVIEEGAFEGCTHLTNIYFDAENCEDFEPYNKVFANAGIKNYGLTVKFSSNVKRIPENLFYPENGPKRIPYIVEVLFEEGFSCDKIRDYAFAYAKSLTKIEIPSSISVIGVNAFVGCSELKEITLTSSIKEIENYAFSGCSSLQNIELPSSITGLGAGVLSYCRNLETLTIPASVIKVGEKAFSDCAKMKTLRCKASIQPPSWDTDWNKGCRAEIVWG